MRAGLKTNSFDDVEVWRVIIFIVQWLKRMIWIKRMLAFRRLMVSTSHNASKLS